MVHVTPAAALPVKTAATVAPPERSLPQATPAKIDDEQLTETNRQNEMARQKKLALASERASQRRAEEAAIKRRQQYAQRMAQRKLAQLEQQQQLQSDTNRREPAVLAFGSDDRPTESGFFRN
jgi:hypothetical protein